MSGTDRSIERIQPSELEAAGEPGDPLWSDSFEVIKDMQVRLEVRLGEARLSVAELMDLRGESAATRRLYGLEAPFPHTRDYGAMCLLARRLVERGVRFVELTCPKVKADRWHTESIDLLDPTLDLVYIRSIQIGGSGWDYHGRADNLIIEAVLGAVPAETDEEDNHGAFQQRR